MNTMNNFSFLVFQRVKRAILKSFGVSGEDDTKCLDDNKRAQIKGEVSHTVHVMLGTVKR